MEKAKIYAYYDEKSLLYDIPFFAKDDINAKRKFFLDVNANNSESVLGQFKDDFTLCKIGEFELKTGVIVMGELQEIMRGKEIKIAKKE